MLAKDYRLEEYRIIDVLGSGGFGVTYVAADETLEERVAIKEFLPAGVASHTGDTVQPVTESARASFEGLLQDFINESRRIARIRHPNVIRVRRCFKRNGTAYLVMDYEDGQDFQHYLQDLGRRPTEAELIRIATPLIDGLQAVHATGLIHRDIKPSNIFIRNGDGSPVLIDFGAARQEDAAHFTAIFTAGYAPIEQYEEASCQGPWTDIYAMAAVLFRAITGTKPPPALNRLALDRLVPVAETCRGRYSARMLAGIDRGLRLLPEDRPRSVAAWRADWLDEAPAPSAPQAPARPIPPTPAPQPAPPRPTPLTAIPAADRDDTVRHAFAAAVPAPPAPATPEELASISERAAWTRAAAAHAAPAYRAFLEHYPEGAFAARGRAALAAIEREAAKAPPSAPALDLPWPEPPPLSPRVRIVAPAAVDDEPPERFDRWELVRPSWGVLGLTAASELVAMVVASLILNGVFHGETLSNLLIATGVSGLCGTGVVVFSREANWFSAAACGAGIALGSVLVFVVLFGKYL